MNRRRYKEPAPERYQVLEYLEKNPGNLDPYIDTGVIQNQNSGMELEFQMVNSDYFMILTGSRTSASANAFCLQITSEKAVTTRYGSLAYDRWNLKSDLNWHKFSLMKNITKYDNYSYTFPNQNFVCPSTTILFGFSDANGYVHVDTSTQNFACMRVKSYKMYDNNILIRDFIPVRRMSDNELGMYDRVSGKFYTNRGTGTFIGGNATGEIIGLTVLPSEYQAVEYLESTGTQWIETEIKPNSESHTICKFDFTGDSARVLGCRDGVGVNAYIANIGYTENRARNYAAFGTNQEWYRGVTQSGTYDFYHGELKLNGQTIISLPYQEFQCNTTSVLFAFKQGNTVNITLNPTKIYSYHYWDNKYKQYFIPCKRKSDNKPGMYDTINNKFYTNAGTGEFLVGPDIDLFLDCDAPGELGPGNPQKAKFIGYKEVSDLLPSDYQEVEYILGNDGSFIDTGIPPTGDLVVDCTFEDTILTSNSLFGSRIAANRNEYHLIRSDAGNRGNLICRYYNGSAGGGVFGLGKYRIVFSNHPYITNLNTGVTTIFTGKDYAEFANNHPIILFGINNNGSKSGGTPAKIFSCKMYTGSIILRNFIPCYRKSDNKPGMYDIINNVFYTNPGTGEFIIGPEVETTQVIVDRLWDYKRGLYNTKTGEFTKL